MFSFEGNYRTKRAQVFDRTEKMTASTIVNRTREERKKRELVRVQNEAAAKIQAFARGILCRVAVKRAVAAEFDVLAKQLNGFSSPIPVNQEFYLSNEFGEFNKMLFRLMRSFNWYCRRTLDKDRLLTACRLLLSRQGLTTSLFWMSSESSDQRFVLGSTLRVVLNYLSSLPALSPSSDYTIPVRFLEDMVSPKSIETSTVHAPPNDSLYSNRLWLYTYLANCHYFRILAQFVDRQLPPTAGYLTNQNATDNDVAVFDPIEFQRVPRAATFVQLVLAPLTWADANLRKEDRSTALKYLLASALNDVLAPDPNASTPSERIVRGIGARLFDTSSALQSISDICLTCGEGTASEGRSIFLVPSVSLLYTLVTVALPKLICPTDSTASPASPVPHNQMELTADNEEADEEGQPIVEHPNVARLNPTVPPDMAAKLVRSIAWLLIHALRAPGMPSMRPLKNPKPLVCLHTDQADESSDEEDEDTEQRNVTGRSDQLQKQPTVYRPAWDTQITDMFSVLRRTLPSLASGALRCLSENTSLSSAHSGALSLDHSDLVRSLAQLHYSLTQIYGLPSLAMIGLNSVYSDHPVYIRSLWHLVQYSTTSRTPTDAAANHGTYPIFNLLSSGELPENLSDVQSYLPLVYTFADCLHHRLLCLTDEEICGIASEPSTNFTFGCGFQTKELLQVGARLRDLMIGLIDISHPDHPPKHLLPEEESDGRSICAKPMPNYRELFERVQMRAEAVAAGASPGASLLMRNTSGWSPLDLRIQLQCWISLFRRVQRLVFQIYDWDRRCHRHSLIQSDMGALCLAQQPVALNDAAFECLENATESSAGLNPFATPTQAFWFKESIASTIDSSLRSWLQHGGDRSTVTLAGTPFGYYSRLNPDMDHGGVNPFILSSREVRQVLILREIPFVIPFERRVRLFQLLLESSRTAVQGSYVPSLAVLATHSDSERYPDVSILVRRTHLYEDAFEKLSKENEASLQPRLRVRFMNQLGTEEAGVDGGGLSREFLSEVLRAGFDPTRGFFIYTAEKTLYPNPQASAITEDYLKHYYFLGRMLAKAIYEGMLIELQFAHFFLAKVVSRSGGSVGFDYLHSLDPELYRQLRNLKNYSGDVRDLSLDFTVVTSTFGQSDTIELKPGGRQIPVTNENRVEYMHLVAYYKLNKQIYPQVKAFTTGLNDVICLDWLRLFDADELQTLISGANTVIDVDDLEKHTVYLQNSSEFSETLKHFWSVLRDLSESDKRLFLRFVTACSRPPMFGFRDLQPPFSIQITQELDRLPTASTCMNLLRLPDFRDPVVLRERLLYALHANAGFEYS
ncbi:Ubiquitin-protein ligase E3C [Clonorchis sinensis]|uniref:HECT-type E3 ubiquitin transferase n=1 Tax=Clonorchis sinensis TaxID=79923 RepID=A0A3R7CAV2_CLOSI|nr:Ubiquitin-protein ligase E3C [Clonorchis sinensis]